MKARLKITLECNRSCPYCINKSKEYRDKWITINSIHTPDWTKYSSIVVSGGEPTILHINELHTILYALRRTTANKNTPIYLQTNGDLLTKSIVKELDNYIDGIGLSIHNLDEFRRLKTRFEDILRIKPIQLYVQDTMLSDHGDYFPSLFDKYDFNLRVWKDGEFDKDEDIFILTPEK